MKRITCLEEGKKVAEVVVAVDAKYARKKSWGKKERKILIVATMAVAAVLATAVATMVVAVLATVVAVPHQTTNQSM